MTSLLSTILLLIALVLAPFVGGGLGELASGNIEILILAAVAWRLIRRKQADREWASVPGLWFLAAFITLMLVSTVHSRAIYFSLNQLLFVSACFGAYFLSTSVCRDGRIATVAVWALVLSALFVSGYAVQHYIIDSGGGAGFWKALMSPGDQARLFGPFVNPNFFAGYLVLALPVTLAVYLSARRAMIAVLPAVAAVFEVIALMLTGAKFGVIAAAVAMVAFLLLAVVTKSLDRSKLIRLAVFVAILLPLLFPFSSPVKNRIHQAAAGGTQVHSKTFRIYTWIGSPELSLDGVLHGKATLGMIRNQPVLGVGPGVYSITYPKYTIAGPTKFAHNAYLQIAAESGIPALLAFLLLLFAIAWRSLRALLKNPGGEASPKTPQSDSLGWEDFVPPAAWKLVCCGIFAALVGSAVRNLVDSDWYVIGIALPFWILAGVLVARSGAAERTAAPGKLVRLLLAAACLVLIGLSVSFAMGDYWDSKANDAVGAAETEQAVKLYSRATAVSPLDPEYHRQLGLWLGLGQGDYDSATAEIEKSISLARNTSEGGWKARGTLAGARGDWPMAISSLKTAVKFNPNSTDTLMNLAAVYRASGDTADYEATLQRLLDIEKSPYEQVKGTPEMIDTSYATAHAYFGGKDLSRKDYPAAVTELKAAIDRLELWRASGVMLKLEKLMGRSNEQLDRSRLDLLRQCYRDLATAYSGMGNRAEAGKALANARKVK